MAIRANLAGALGVYYLSGVDVGSGYVVAVSGEL